MKPKQHKICYRGDLLFEFPREEYLLQHNQCKLYKSVIEDSLSILMEIETQLTKTLKRSGLTPKSNLDGIEKNSTKNNNTK